MEDRTYFITNEVITRETIIEGKSVKVTTEEEGTAGKKLKADKAAGPGNILAELLKNTPQKLYKMIAQLFTICMNEHINTQGVENSAYHPHLQTR